MNTSVGPIEMLRLILAQQFSEQTLRRIPETLNFYNDQDKSREYALSENSKMAVPYAVAINIIHRIVPMENRRRAIELCSGPGIFTRQIHTAGGFSHSLGVDISDSMLTLATAEAHQRQLQGQVQFIKRNILQLNAEAESDQERIGESGNGRGDSHSLHKGFDLVAFMNGAHHLDRLEEIETVLQNMEHLCSDEGVIFVMDPCRPKTKETADLYVSLYGRDYKARGLNLFFEDFRESILASWTPEEFKGVIPLNTKRHWIQIVPRGFPAFHFLIGLPLNRQKLWINRSLDKTILESILPPEHQLDYTLLSLLTRFGATQTIQTNPRWLNALSA